MGIGGSRGEADAHVPLLARRYFMAQLGAILDLLDFMAHVRNLKVTIYPFSSWPAHFSQ